jgi:hemerythrin superfamily protein
VVDEIIKELSVHAAIEEKVFYPAVRDLAKQKGQELVLESLEEHHLVKVMLKELEGMSSDDERYEAKVHVLMENVLHHAKEEEKEMFPQARKVMDAQELRELGRNLEEAKRSAPTRPHPNAPDTPPASLVTSPAAAVMDAGRDMLRDSAEELRRSIDSAE